MSRLTIEVVHLRSGQPRAYADSFYEADLNFGSTWDSTTGERPGEWCPPKETVRDLARLLVRGFKDKPEHGLEPHLEKLEKTGPQSYRVLIVEPYCD